MRIMRALLPFLVACASTGRTRYVGREAPYLRAPEAVEIQASTELPAGYTVLGVVTAACETYDDASGLLERPCTQEELLTGARTKASEVGGSLLVEPLCERRVVERSIERIKNGGAKGHERIRLDCRASVARPPGENGSVVPNLARTPVSQALRPSVRVTVGTTELLIGLAPSTESATREPRAVDEVTELERPPVGSVKLGTVWSECQVSCSSAVARRALKQAAAEAGAFVLSGATCEPVGDRWRCQGTAMGEPKLPADAPKP